MNKNQDHIDQLTPDLMQRYLDGKLSNDMQHKVERYLLDHPFEAEAMEGFEAVGMTQLESDVEQIKKRLFEEEKEVKIIPIWQQYWKVAAVVTLLIVSTLLILNLGDQQINSSDEELALNEVPSIVEEEALDKKGEVTEPVATDEISAEEEAQDVIPVPSPIVDATMAMEDEEMVVDDIKESIESSEAQTMSATSALAKSTATSQAKAINEEKVEVLSMIESDNLAKKKAMTDELVLENEDSNIADLLSGRVAGVSISNSKQDQEVIPAKEKTIKGTITSSEDGSALPGVNVILKGTNHGVISDVEGNYELTVPDGENFIAVSFIGYENEEIEVGDRDVVDVSMFADVSALSEVVVTAYAIEREKKSLGYAVSKTKEVRKQRAQPLIGLEAYNKYLQDSLRYPQQAIDNQISGIVTMEITINEIGQISNIVVKEGLGYGCDEEAVRLINEGTGWQHAIKRGNPIEEKVKINVTFEQ